MIWPLAITGGIAEGKSTVVGFLSHFGLRTFSADRAVAQLWQSQSVVSEVLEILELPSGSTKYEIREEMARSHTKRRLVNSFFHPMVLSQMHECDAQVFELPLLLETCMQNHFRSVWAVTCGPQEQLKRLIERFGNREIAESALRMQLASRTKCAFADEVIRTNQNIEDVKREVYSAAGKTFGNLGGV